MKLLRYLAGVAVGAGVTGFCGALALLYTMTGRFLVPSDEGVRLADQAEALELAKRLADDASASKEEEE